MKNSPLERKTPLRAGAKSIGRGSTFSSRSSLQGKPGGSTLKAGKGMGASSAQKSKVRAMAGSIVSAQEPVDAAHIFPRGMGGCLDAMCVVPLTRLEHIAYDSDKLDLLPHLLSHGLVEELQHALGHANGDLIGLLHIVTGCRWVPEEKAS